MATPRSQSGTAELPLAAKVAFLRQPEAYPEGTRAVELVETHWSWVFLTDRHAYKLKKPVRSRYFDFTTIAARRRNCEEEIRLNRRLAADVYLQIVPLGHDGDRLALGHDGGAVEWLVKMRRLPADRALQHLVEARHVGDADVARLARRLIDFYAGAPRVPTAPDAYLDAFASGIAESLATLSIDSYGLPAAAVSNGVAAVRHLLEGCRSALTARAESGRIVEAHGDLRPEHIYLLDDGPRIVDCLEFALALRALDPLDELCFLSLECARLGDPATGSAVLEQFQRDSGDAAPAGLIAFYTAYRALVRARLAIQHLEDGPPDLAGKWRSRAADYLDRIAGLLRQQAESGTDRPG